MPVNCCLKLSFSSIVGVPFNNFLIGLLLNWFLHISLSSSRILLIARLLGLSVPAMSTLFGDVRGFLVPTKKENRIRCEKNNDVNNSFLLKKRV